YHRLAPRKPASYRLRLPAPVRPVDRASRWESAAKRRGGHTRTGSCEPAELLTNVNESLLVQSAHQCSKPPTSFLSRPRLERARLLWISKDGRSPLSQSRQARYGSPES